MYTYLPPVHDAVHTLTHIAWCSTYTHTHCMMQYIHSHTLHHTRSMHSVFIKHNPKLYQLWRNAICTDTQHESDVKFHFEFPVCHICRGLWILRRNSTFRRYYAYPWLASDVIHWKVRWNVPDVLHLLSESTRPTALEGLFGFTFVCKMSKI
jgi:hypothetical protein